jgi:hypothetical protein
VFLFPNCNPVCVHLKLQAQLWGDAPLTHFSHASQPMHMSSVRCVWGTWRNISTCNTSTNTVHGKLHPTRVNSNHPNNGMWLESDQLMKLELDKHWTLTKLITKKGINYEHMYVGMSSISEGMYTYVGIHLQLPTYTWTYVHTYNRLRCPYSGPS